MGIRINPELLSVLSMIGRDPHQTAESANPADRPSSEPRPRSVLFATEHGFSSAEGASKIGPWHVPSLSETVARQRLQNDPRAWVIHNMNYMSAVAPRASNVNESSLDVVAYWDAGCQLLPVSIPIGGPQLQLGMGKFMLNGQCGYVLKPRRLREAKDATRAPLDLVPRRLCR